MNRPDKKMKRISFLILSSLSLWAPNDNPLEIIDWLQKAWENPNGYIAQKLNNAVVIRSKPNYSSYWGNEHDFSNAKDLLCGITQEDLDIIKSGEC